MIQIFFLVVLAGGNRPVKVVLVYDGIYRFDSRVGILVRIDGTNEK